MAATPSFEIDFIQAQLGRTGTSFSFVDINGDGAIDIFVGDTDGTLWFLDMGGPSSEQNPFGLTDVGDSSKPDFVDIDGDGDFDAFVGNSSGQTVFFENTGSPTAPAFAAASINPFGLSLVDGMARPTLVDIDFDGDLDAFIGNQAGLIIFFPNQGSPSAPAFGPPTQDPFGLMPVDSVSTPAFADVDLDNDLDAYIGNGPGDIIYFENIGTFASPSFAAPITNPFGLSRNGEVASPSFFDFDADGDLEPLIGTRGGANTQYDNVGGPCPPSFATGVANRFGIDVFDTNANPAFG